MPRKSPSLEIAEISGDRYPNLKTVQGLALTPFARYLTETLYRLLAAGKLVLEDGQLIVAHSQKGTLDHVH